MSVFLCILATLAKLVPDLGMTDGQENAIAYGLVMIVSVYNTYATLATSKAVGTTVKPK